MKIPTRYDHNPIALPEITGIGLRRRGIRSALAQGIVTSIRTRVIAVTIITAFTALLGGPLFAASTHEVCDAMDHGCAKIDAPAGCCCGEVSDVRPSQVPVGRADVSPSAHAVLVTVAPEMPALTAALLHRATPTVGQPPDLRILFSDLRL